MRGSRRSCDSFICFLASDALFSLFFFLRSSLEMGAPRESASTLRGAESKHDFFSTHVVFASSMEKKETYRVERPNRSECSPAFSPSSSNVEGTFSLIDSEETVDPVHPVVHNEPQSRFSTRSLSLSVHPPPNALLRPLCARHKNQELCEGDECCCSSVCSALHFQFSLLSRLGLRRVNEIQMLDCPH